MLALSQFHWVYLKLLSIYKLSLFLDRLDQVETEEIEIDIIKIKSIIMVNFVFVYSNIES